MLYFNEIGYPELAIFLFCDMVHDFLEGPGISGNFKKDLDFLIIICNKFLSPIITQNLIYPIAMTKKGTFAKNANAFLINAHDHLYELCKKESKYFVDLLYKCTNPKTNELRVLGESFNVLKSPDSEVERLSGIGNRAEVVYQLLRLGGKSPKCNDNSKIIYVIEDSFKSDKYFGYIYDTNRQPCERLDSDDYYTASLSSIAGIFDQANSKLYTTNVFNQKNKRFLAHKDPGNVVYFQKLVEPVELNINLGYPINVKIETVKPFYNEKVNYQDYLKKLLTLLENGELRKSFDGNFAKFTKMAKVLGLGLDFTILFSNGFLDSLQNEMLKTHSDVKSTTWNWIGARFKLMSTPRTYKGLVEKITTNIPGNIFNYTTDFFYIYYFILMAVDINQYNVITESVKKIIKYGDLSQKSAMNTLIGFMGENRIKQKLNTNLDFDEFVKLVKKTFNKLVLDNLYNSVRVLLYGDFLKIFKSNLVRFANSVGVEINTIRKKKALEEIMKNFAFTDAEESWSVGKFQDLIANKIAFMGSVGNVQKYIKDYQNDRFLFIFYYNFMVVDTYFGGIITSVLTEMLESLNEYPDVKMTINDVNVLDDTDKPSVSNMKIKIRTLLANSVLSGNELKETIKEINTAKSRNEKSRLKKEIGESIEKCILPGLISDDILQKIFNYMFAKTMGDFSQIATVLKLNVASEQKECGFPIWFLSFDQIAALISLYLGANTLFQSGTGTALGFRNLSFSDDYNGFTDTIDIREVENNIYR